MNRYQKKFNNLDTKERYCSISKLFGGSKGGSNAAAAADPYYNKAIAEMQRQFGITQKNLTPFIEAGTAALPQVQQGTTPQGLDEMLGQIFNTDIFGNLVDERTRSVEGQLAAGGLTRSGTALQEIANVPTSIGLALEELLSGRATNLAGSGQNAAAGLGSLGAQNSSGIASLLMNQGKNLSSGIITDAQSESAGGQNLLNTAVSLGSIFFSDPKLKQNIEKISNIYDLNLYQWDWIPEAKGTMIEQCSTTGFLTTEVKELYPEYVDNFCGFDVIDYPELLDHLKLKEAA